MRVAAAQNTAAVSSIGRGPSSGATFLTQAIQGIADRIAERTRLGQPPRTELVVVDIDNTILDSRYRTLGALQRFGRAKNIPELRDLALNDVRIDGASTVAHLELDAKYSGLGKAAQAAWTRFFWPPTLAPRSSISPVATTDSKTRPSRGCGSAARPTAT